MRKVFRAAARVVTWCSVVALRRAFKTTGATIGKIARHQSMSRLVPTVGDIVRAALLAVAAVMTRPPPQPGPPFFPAPVKRGGGMSEAQRVDLMAAQAGKITWAQYFALWGPGG